MVVGTVSLVMTSPNLVPTIFPVFEDLATKELGVFALFSLRQLICHFDVHNSTHNNGVHHSEMKLCGIFALSSLRLKYNLISNELNSNLLVG